VTEHHGSCHCGQVQFDVSIDLTQPVMTCNCSMCARSGTMLAFVPAEQFTLRSGEAALVDYQWGRRHIHHLFCSRCGIKSFARGTGRDGRAMIAVNVRCLDGVNVDEVPIRRFDGKSLPVD
jgi:hypothetical protein